MDLGVGGGELNQFQAKSLANMAFDLAKVEFAAIFVAGEWVRVLAALVLGILFVVVGLWIGRKVKNG